MYRIMTSHGIALLGPIHLGDWGPNQQHRDPLPTPLPHKFVGMSALVALVTLLQALVALLLSLVALCFTLVALLSTLVYQQKRSSHIPKLAHYLLHTDKVDTKNCCSDKHFKALRNHTKQTHTLARM